jgi:hypothetical protein
MIPAESRWSRPGGLTRLPEAAGGYRPTVSRAGLGRPQAGPKDREAPLTRPAGAVGAAGRP